MALGEETASVQSHETLEEALHKCPAFSNAQSCPFKDAATSPQAMQAAMLTIPPSHYQMKAFTTVLSKLHDAATSDPSFSLPGGCPVPAEIKQSMSFRQAMEDLSLAAVMGRLAEQANHDDNQNESENDESEEFTVPSTEVSEMVPAKDDGPAQTTTTTKIARPSLSESLKTGTAASHQAAEDGK